MKRDRAFTAESQITAVRIPEPLRSQAKNAARKEDLTFSQFARRALRKELGITDSAPEDAKKGAA